MPSEEPDVLLRRYARFADPADLDRLVRRFRPLARKLALRYARGSDPVDDLEQVANLGLVKALKRFDPDRGFAFTSFAVPTILGELKRSFRDTAWSAHVPRAVQERVAEVRKVIDGWAGEQGRSPTPREVAERLSCTEEEVVEALHAQTALAPVSLDGRVGGDEEDGVSLGDRLGDTDPGYELVDDRRAIADALPLLTEQQRAVLRLRFEHDMKQSEIAAQLACSQMQVSRVLRGALETLGLVVNHRSCAPVRQTAA